MTPSTHGERWVLDRRAESGPVVHLPDGRVVDLPASWVPADAVEGDHLWVGVEGGAEEVVIRIRIDAGATRAARERTRQALRRLGARDG